MLSLRRRRVVVALPVVSIASVLVVLLFVSGCSGGAPDTAAPPAATMGTAAAGTDGVQSITVTGDAQMRFNPSMIKAKPGKLRITLHTTSGTPHDLEVLPSKTNTGLVGQGQQRTIEVALTSGRYDFVCTFHETSNMVGVIDVS